MKILYIYRSRKSGPSIRRVFEPIVEVLSINNDIYSMFLPFEGASPIAIYNNIRFVTSHLHNNNYDIIHITGDVYYLLWSLQKYKVVVTVHDLLFYTRINNIIKKKFMYWLELYPLRYAKQITFISYSSRNEALKLLEIKDGKCHVINNPLNTSFIPFTKEISKDKPLILHLGTKPNKNLPKVIEALKGINCKLHIVGNISQELYKKIIDYSIDTKIESNLSDEQILSAYKECDIVSFPSLYEGFGMPIIEGQMIGRIVVTSNIEPMKTVAGGAAILVNPNDTDSIRQGFKKAMEYDNHLIEQGFENAKKYSVTNISHQYYELYKSTLLK